MLTVSVSVLVVTPAPRQSLHLSLTTVPSPRQLGQTVPIMKKPCWWTTWPRPPHVGQRSGREPAAAPVPAQPAHVTRRLSSTSLAHPATASANASRTSRRTSPPRRAPRRPRPPPP